MQPCGPREELGRSVASVMHPRYKSATRFLITHARLRFTDSSRAEAPRGPPRGPCRRLGCFSRSVSKVSGQMLGRCCKTQQS